jgi:hypothetical protein
MTGIEKEEERKKRRLVGEERNHLIEKRIRKLRCECEAEKMRQGIFCPTCRLLVKVNDYLLDLFKDAAEGRSSVI